MMDGYVNMHFNRMELYIKNRFSGQEISNGLKYLIIQSADSWIHRTTQFKAGKMANAK